MIIRFLLIGSLIGQLAFSYQCCGITILCECLAWTSECDRSQCTGAQCDEIASSCCATMASCGSSCETKVVSSENECDSDDSVSQQCCGTDCEAPPAENETTSPLPTSPQCTPIDPKAPRSPDAVKSIIDMIHLMPAMLHPAIAAPVQVHQPQPHNDWPIQPQFKSNHQRQATLEVWLN